MPLSGVRALAPQPRKTPRSTPKPENFKKIVLENPTEPSNSFAKFHEFSENSFS